MQTGRPLVARSVSGLGHLRAYFGEVLRLCGASSAILFLADANAGGQSPGISAAESGALGFSAGAGRHLPYRFHFAWDASHRAGWQQWHRAGAVDHAISEATIRRTKDRAGSVSSSADSVLVQRERWFP